MNVIWIISDTIRKDVVGAYGNKQIHTPALDTFAKKSVRFDRHLLASFPTMPARADFLTGRWTMSFMQWEPMPKSETTLPQIIAKNNIDTAAIVDTPFYLRDGMGYDRGFLTFNEIPGHYYVAKGGGKRRMDAVDIPTNYRMESACFAPQTFARAMEWLELHYKDNFFLYIDTWDPHEPWNAPKYYTEMYAPDYDGEMMRPLYGYLKNSKNVNEAYVKKAKATYCGEMTMVDTWVGNLLSQAERMGLMENTAVIFTTDHGYYFGEHGGLYGKMVFSFDSKLGPGAWDRSPLYHEVTTIPLFIYVPGVKPGVYNGLTSAVDIMPTVLDIMGLEVPARVEGQSLLPRMRNPSLPGRDYVISAAPFINTGDMDHLVDHILRPSTTDSMATVTTKDWALLYDTAPGGSELYNLKTDPEQVNNIIAKNPAVARELHGILKDFMVQTKVPDRLQQSRRELKLSHTAVFCREKLAA